MRSLTSPLWPRTSSYDEKGPPTGSIGGPFTNLEFLFESSDSHDFLFLRFEQLLDPLDLGVGQLLYLLVGTLFVIGRD